MHTGQLTQLQLHNFSISKTKSPFASQKSQKAGFPNCKMHPFSKIETIGFKNLVSILKLKFQMPSRTQLSPEVKTDLYTKGKKNN